MNYRLTTLALLVAGPALWGACTNGLCQAEFYCVNGNAIVQCTGDDSEGTFGGGSHTTTPDVMCTAPNPYCVAVPGLPGAPDDPICVASSSPSPECDGGSEAQFCAGSVAVTCRGTYAEVLAECQSPSVCVAPGFAFCALSNAPDPDCPDGGVGSYCLDGGLLVTCFAGYAIPSSSSTACSPGVADAGGD